MDNWGEIKKEKIEDDDDFWCLYDEIVNDDSCFLDNREYILHSYKEGKRISSFFKRRNREILLDGGT